LIAQSRVTRQIASGAVSAQITTLFKSLVLMTQYQHSVPRIAERGEVLVLVFEMRRTEIHSVFVDHGFDHRPGAAMSVE